MKYLLLLILLSSCSDCPYIVQYTEKYKQGYKITTFSKCQLTAMSFYSLQNYSIGDTLK
jgi:hypothetical protein